MEKALASYQAGIHGESLYNFLEVSFADLVKYPNGIQDLYTRRIDGFLIKGVLNPDEVSTVLSGLRQLVEADETYIDEGFRNYPMSFAQVDQHSEGSRERMANYFTECLSFRESFSERFGVDYESKLQAALEMILNGKKASVPAGIEGTGTFTPGNFRRLIPGPGTIKAHCGNYFHAEFPQFYHELEQWSVIKDQLSYFFMLQTPEAGGELCLFDVEWKDAEKRLSGDTVLQKHDGSHVDLDGDQVKRQFVCPDAGDLIVFAGGTIWHRVEYIRGNRDRITLGGFMSLARDESGIHYWT